MGRLCLVVALSLACVGGASAEVVAPRIQSGMLALTPNDAPVVAYVRGTTLEIATRISRGHWARARAASVAQGSSVVALAAGPAGPVALVEGTDDRTLFLVRRSGPAWRVTRLARGLPPGVLIGAPGLALDKKGLPVVAYSRWRQSTRLSALELVRIDAGGRVHGQRVTSQGFPKSYVAPPAVPVFARTGVHVIESYGIDGAVGTIEWYPKRKAWVGQFIDGGVGDFPVGPLFATTDPSGTVFAAWTEAFLGLGEQPVTLAVRGREIESKFVFTRALTTGLVATGLGPEVAANEWLTAEEIGVAGDDYLWAGAIAGHGRRVELDGVIDGLAAPSRRVRDVLLTGTAGLSWFRSPRPLSLVTTITAAAGPSGVVVSGHVRGATSGKVTIYRERPGAARSPAGVVPLGADGAFSFVDKSQTRPLIYRAVYTDPATRIPYGALLRQPVR